MLYEVITVTPDDVRIVACYVPVRSGGVTQVALRRDRLKIAGQAHLDLV